MHQTHGRPRGLLAVLTVALVIGVVALVLSFQNALDLNRQSEARNQDRIEADLQACERGNVLRQQIIDLGNASDNTIRKILDTIFGDTASPARREAIAALRRELDVPLDEYRQTVLAIRLTDCAQAVPGAQEAPS